jgi:hypothetical protein
MIYRYQCVGGDPILDFSFLISRSYFTQFKCLMESSCLKITDIGIGCAGNLDSIRPNASEAELIHTSFCLCYDQPSGTISTDRSSNLWSI